MTAAQPVNLEKTQITLRGVREPQRAKEGRNAQRFRLRAVAADLLGEHHRTGTCGRRCDPTVSILRKPHGNCCYAGLETCGSVWTCPVCAAKVAARRTAEVSELAAAHQAQGLPVFMVTFTFEHHGWQTADELREHVAKAWAAFQNGSTAQKLRREKKLAGYVRSIEVTHGKHGWHPHIHALFFIGVDLDEAGETELADTLFARWEAVCGRRSIYASPKAFDCRRAHDGGVAAEYVVKWGAACEIASSPMKKGKRSRSPWQLLEAAGRGDDRAGRLFIEYAAAFKGARQVSHSRGIRELYGLRAEAADDELVSADDLPMDEGECSEIYRIDQGTWTRVARAGLAGALLDIATNGGSAAVHDFLCETGIGPSYEKVSERFRQWQPQTDFNQGKELEEWTFKTPPELWQRRRQPDPETSARQETQALSTCIEAMRSKPKSPTRKDMERLWQTPGTRAEKPRFQTAK